MRPLGVGIAAAASLLVACRAPAPTIVCPRGPSPNVVLVVIDDLSFDDAGPGRTDPRPETPRIDRIALEGARFTHAYAAAAVCSPSRAAIQTGNYPARLGITDWIRARFQGGRNEIGLAPGETTIAERLRDAGYATAHVGKWHLGDGAFAPERQGYGVNAGGCDLGEPPSYFDPFERPPRLTGIPGLPPRRAGEYLVDREADEACAFIRANAGRPFLLHRASYAIHTPHEAKPELVEKWTARLGAERRRAAVAAAMIESLDAALGRVLEVLDDLDLSHRTLVVFTSDNGGLKSVSRIEPLRGEKGEPYEGGIRVPLFVRFPGAVPAGLVRETPVGGIDLAPTIVSAAIGERLGLDGADLLALLRAGAPDRLPREDLFWHFPHRRSETVGPWSAARWGSWKLVRWWAKGRDEIYDLAADPAERRDLSRERPEVAREIARRLDAHLRETRATLPEGVNRSR